MIIIVCILIAISVIIGIESEFRSHSLDKIIYRLSFSENKVFEGDELRLVEEMHNNKTLPIPWINAEIFSSKWLEYAGTKSVISQDYRYVTSSYYLTPHQKVTRSWKLKCTKRGVFDITDVSLVSGGIFGGGRHAVHVKMNSRLTVYPKPIDVASFFEPKNINLGNITVKRWIFDDPFIIAGAREYLPGDPMNRIHWNATAASGRLMVRRNEYTSEISACILFNIQEFENEVVTATDKINVETGIKAIAGIMDQVMRSGIPVRLITNGCHPDDPEAFVLTESASGHAHGEKLMELLARLNLGINIDFIKFLPKIKDQITDEDVIVVTAYLDREMCDLLREYRNKWRSLKILVSNPYYQGMYMPDDLDIYIPRARE